MLICCNNVLYICMQMFMLKPSLEAKYHNNIYAKVHKFI